jgi:hypothetical protein
MSKDTQNLGWTCPACGINHNPSVMSCKCAHSGEINSTLEAGLNYDQRVAIAALANARGAYSSLSTLYVRNSQSRIQQKIKKMLEAELLRAETAKKNHDKVFKK